MDFLTFESIFYLGGTLFVLVITIYFIWWYIKTMEQIASDLHAIKEKLSNTTDTPTEE